MYKYQVQINVDKHDLQWEVNRNDIYDTFIKYSYFSVV